MAILKESFGIKISMHSNSASKLLKIKPCSDMKRLETVLLRVISELSMLPKSFMKMLPLKEIKICDKIKSAYQKIFSHQRLITDFIQLECGDSEAEVRSQLGKIIMICLSQNTPNLCKEWQEVLTRVQGGYEKNSSIAADMGNIWSALME